MRVSVNPMQSRAYSYYVLGMLTLVYALHSVDRGLMILLLQPIKEDLRLTDTELGLLTGIVFGLFYATLGIPVARWADRGNRVTITSMAIGLWGVTVMACSQVTSFIQLASARAAAAIGEAGCMPPTYSLLGDYFPRARDRTRTMTLYWLGGPLSALVTLMLGGWLNDRYGWRMTFILMGIPGLLVALLVKLTIREPRTRDPAVLARRTAPAPRMAAVLGMLWQQRTSRHLCLAIVLLFTMGSGMGPWYAAFMMRSHAMTTAELGVWLGLINGLGGASGMLLGGYAASKWFAQDEQGQLRLIAVMIALMLPFLFLFVTLPDKHHALLALIPMMVLWCAFAGPAFALLQRLTAEEIRATTLAVVMLLANLIGMGGGPQIVGILSDSWAPIFGSDSLRYAMLTMSLPALWSAWHFWRAGETVEQDLRA